MASKKDPPKGVKHAPNVVSDKKGDKVVSVGGVKKPEIVISPIERPIVKKSDSVSTTTQTWVEAIPPLGRAMQIYTFGIGKGVRPEAQVTFFYKGWSEGQPESSNALVIYAWAYPGWEVIASIPDTTQGANIQPVEIPITNPDMYLNKEVYFAVVNQKISNPALSIHSRIHTEYIYMTIKEAAYIYEYSWDGLPQGDSAALVLECFAAGPEVDATGVEVHNVGLNIISSN